MYNAIAALEKIRPAHFRYTLLFAIFMCALLLRCWPRLVSPQVWAEDGILVLHGFINEGWATFFQPVNGYWQLIGKLISGAALGLSLYHYPVVSIVLTCLFTAFVGLAVALSPTVLRGRFLCALAIFLVPTDAEVYGLPLYAFWWAGILLFLLALWDERHANPGWRTGFLLIGGLSSPVIVAILPVLYWRAYVYRNAGVEKWLALLATLAALLQTTYMAAGGSAPRPSLIASLPYVVPKFFGGFLVGNIGGNAVWAWLAGIMVIASLLLWFRCDIAHKGRWILLYLLAGSIALSVVRVDPALLSTHGAGPRYFFYPFIILLWISIQLYSAKSGILGKRFAGGILALAIINMLPVMTRFHNDLEWAAHVRSCRQFPAYSIPVEVDGKQPWLGWELKLKGTDCDRFLRRDSLVSMSTLAKLSTFAYTTQRANWRQPEPPVQAVANTMTGSDFPASTRAGYRIIGSYSETGAGAGEVRLRMKKGESVLYRSGVDKAGQSIEVEGYEQRFISTAPISSDWIKLTFSNMELPAEFTVRIRDVGTDRQQWSAIALHEADAG